MARPPPSRNRTPMINLTRSVQRNMKTSSALLSLLFVAAAPLANAADGKLVIEAGKIVTLTGEVIENGKIEGAMPKRDLFYNESTEDMFD